MNAPASLARRTRPLLLAALLPLAAVAAPAGGGPDADLASELAGARAEVERELAAARAELQSGNLELGVGAYVGPNKHKDARNDLPRGEITPAGDLLVDGKAVAIDDAQRALLLAYRRQAIDVAVAGIEVGEKAANAALDVVDRGLLGLMASAMTGRLERQLESSLRSTLEPGILQLCRNLPGLYASQQALAAAVPEFRPYASMTPEDVHNCEAEVRREFARL